MQIRKQNDDYAELGREMPLQVLIVDDSRLQRRILSASLSKLGYVVRECESGVDALEACRDVMPDLVLSDWMMPGMDGLEFCQHFKAMEREGYGYFILLTSKSAKDEVAAGLENGADDFLTKPVNGHELRARLAAGERIIRMQQELSEKNRVVSSTLRELQDVHESLNSDLIEAKKLQQSLVREKQKDISGTSLSFLLRSSGHVGGDLVGYYPVSDTKVCVFAIDVSGHGISSALITARLAGHLTSPSADHNLGLFEDAEGVVHAREPADVVADLNRVVLEEMDTDHYFTILLAVVDLDTGNVSVCQAGHPYPLIQRKNGDIIQDGSGGLPVGLFDEAEFEQFELHLNKGDRLILSSDGITECPGADGGMLEEEGFADMMRELHHLRGQDMLEMLMWTLADFAGDGGFPDDVSAAVIEFGTAQLTQADQA